MIALGTLAAAWALVSLTAPSDDPVIEDAIAATQLIRTNV
jgi:hypothetical protein